MKCKVCKSNDIFTYGYENVNKTAIPIYECRDCGFLFVLKNCSSDPYKDITLNNYTINLLSKYKEKIYSNVLTRIRKLNIKKILKLLDIGSGI